LELLRGRPNIYNLVISDKLEGKRVSNKIKLIIIWYVRRKCKQKNVTEAEEKGGKLLLLEIAHLRRVTRFYKSSHSKNDFLIRV